MKYMTLHQGGMDKIRLGGAIPLQITIVGDC